MTATRQPRSRASALSAPPMLHGMDRRRKHHDIAAWHLTWPRREGAAPGAARALGRSAQAPLNEIGAAAYVSAGG